VARSLFGTDGVRGVANVELTARLAFTLAQAAGTGLTVSVLIGRDTRQSGPMLAQALHAGFNSVGVDTVDLGVIPVGGVARLTQASDAGLGVMVSASHNPAADNGIKLIGADGNKLSDARELEISDVYFAIDSGASEPVLPTGSAVGTSQPDADGRSKYLALLEGRATQRLDGISVVADCANGAASEYAGPIFETLGADVEVRFASPTGMNINDGCGATHPETLAANLNGRIGFCFDGDADRCIAVDEQGAVLNGDVIMAILGRHMKSAGTLANDTLVATVMSNLGFKIAMRELGIAVIETSVGDRYVLEEMQRSGATLGGEQSGHVVLEDRLSGDGLQTAVRLAGVVAATGQPLSELRRVMRQFPQVLENVTVRDRTALDGAAAVWDAVHTAEEQLGDEGRVLVRASGTEPLVRVMVEAASADSARQHAAAISHVVISELG